MAYLNEVLKTSPTLLWALTSTHLAADQSGNDRPGTGAGGITVGGSSLTPIHGDTSSTDFDGSDDLIAAASYAAVASSGVRTMAGWAYRDASADADAIWGTDLNNGPALRLIGGGNNVNFRPTLNSATNEVTWTSAWPGNTTWVHWALILSRTDNTVALYVNGSLVSSQALGAYTTTAGVFRIGIGGTATAPWDGKQAYAGVWERALTAAEIAQLYYVGPRPVGVPIPSEPYVDDHLAVSVTHADGRVTRWGPDERLAQDRPMGIGFSTSVPGGFKDCTLTLPRRIDLDYSDLNLLDEVKVYGKGGESVWEGRVVQIPRSHGDDTTIQVGCVGHSSHLRDDTSFSEIYVDRDLANWGNPSNTRRIALLGAGGIEILSDPSVDGDATSGLPALNLAFDGTGGALDGACEAWYDAGSANLIGSIYYDYTSTNTLSTYSGVIGTSDDANATNVSLSSDLLTGTNSSGTGTQDGTDYRFGIIQFRSSGITPSEATHLMSIRRLAVFGDHGLTKQGTAPNDGFYASDVIANIVSRAAPLLNYTTGAGGSIEATTFVIPQLEFREPTTAEDAILRTNAYHLYEWGVYEDKRFFFRAPDPDRLCWEARLSEGAHLDLEGDQAESIFNGVIVRYTDPAGAPKTVGPTGASTDATDSSLADTSESNPVNAHGIPRKWAVLDVSQTTTQAGAIQLGAVFLAEQALPQRRGQLTVKGTIQHPTAGRRPVSRVRAGDYVRLSDHPNDVPRRVIETSYNHDSGEMTMSLDNSVFKLEAILERLGFFVGAANAAAGPSWGGGTGGGMGTGGGIHH